MESNLPEQPDRPNQLRRRLARGGLAGTVVLGSLISKPVLGAPSLSVPQHCTISGQMSGNMSPRVGDNILCSSLGLSPSEWLKYSIWPAAVTRGALPTATVAPFNYPFTNIGTVFNGFSGLANSFEYNIAGAVANTSSATRNASILQVLSTTNAAAAFVFGREAAAAVLNSYGTIGAYPLTTAQVVAMYNAVHTGMGTFPVNATTNWTRTQVQAYWQQLHT